jgi:hypothetical protein
MLLPYNQLYSIQVGASHGRNDLDSQIEEMVGFDADIGTLGSW